MSTLTSPLIPNASHSVPAVLNYSIPSPNTPAGEKWKVEAYGSSRNFSSTSIPTTIYDLRGQEAVATVNSVGFQPITSPSSISSDFILNSSEEEVASKYYPEVVSVLLKHTGASRVVIFDHTIRRPKDPNVPETPSTRTPGLGTHGDQTPISAHKRVERHVQPPQPHKRFQLINLWRPLLNTVHDYPLAMCDFNTLDIFHDLEPTTLQRRPPTPSGEVYSVKHNSNQVWWYWSEMTPDDILFLLCYDSASRAMSKIPLDHSGAEVSESELRDVAGLAPHTAFKHEEGDKKGIRRHSIEVRALVFYD